MSSGLRGTNPLNIFRWKRSSESYLTTGLLNDVPPEVELSDYGRVPSPGSESPSGLLHGETLKVELVTDLDLFFERLYSYYCEKGLWCIIVKWIVELLSLVFTICFSAFFLLYVDWNGLRNAKCGMDAVESGTGPCDLANEALHHHPLTPFTLHKAIILGYLGIFSVYSILCFLRFFAQLRHTLKIRHFYRNSLHVTDSELQTLQWATVLEKVVKVQTTEQLCVVKDLSAHEIVMRLMRKENYLIGMINKGVLAFPIAKCIPGAGPTVKFGSNGKQQRLILTKTLEWTLNWCILQSMFDRNFCIRRDFISNPDALKKRLLVVGVVMLLLSPFLVIFMLVYLFLRHAEQFYKHPTSVSSRRWSNLSRWVLRELNEVDHLFKHRINSSAIHASDYLKQFPSPIISIIAKFISFISGGFAAVLIIIALLDESLLEGHIYGRNLWWYAAVFGTITAISRAAVTDEVLVLDPEREMSLVVQHTHYLPKRWRGKVNTEKVRKEFETLFQYTTMMWLEEMASIFLTPYLLIFVVPKRVDDILQFITDFTVNVEGVGHVCSFSVFDFQNHGNSNYGSPCNTDRFKRSSQGKMEKSFLSFQSSYLFWEPDSQGAQFLLTLRKFRDQQLRGTIDGYACSTSPQRMWQWSPNRRDSQYTLTSQSARDQPLSGHHLSSMWLIETNPRTHPYLLDWYYTSRPQNGHLNPASAPREVTRNIPGDQPNQRECWMPQPQFHGEDRIHEPMWVNNDTTNSDFQARSSSHLEASTSTPFFQEPSGSVLFQHPAKSQWWLRGSPGRDPQGSNPQASFLEPPQFNTYHSGDHYSDIHSERSSEVEERDGFHWGLHNSLSQTTYTHDLPSAGEFRLHFDDVYRPTTEGESHSVGPEFTGSFEPYSVEPELTRSYDPPSMVPERTRSFDPPSMEQERARSFEPRSMEPALNRSFDPQPDLSRSFG